METLGNLESAKSATKYFCKFCHYSTSRKCNFDDHLNSLKHSKNQQMETNGNKISEKSAELNICCEICSKKFNSRSGLWKHKLKKCEKIINETTDVISLYKNTISNKDELIITLLKQNAELIKGQQDMMVKITENGINNHSNNTTHTNSHNKAFNLQFFLNETCKEAMNIGEFVDSIKLQLSDLEHVGEAGYIEGISSIIVKNLRDLDITKRPVHCTDKKRETVYIKDDNKWEKDEDKSKMHKLIKRVVSKNTKMFDKFREAHPDCRQYHSKFSDQYNKIVYESMGGKGDNDFEKNEKIIKNVLKEVIVDKNI
jgi:hypothetical protein